MSSLLLTSVCVLVLLGLVIMSIGRQIIEAIMLKFFPPPPSTMADVDYIEPRLCLIYAAGIALGITSGVIIAIVVIKPWVDAIVAKAGC